MLGQTAAVTKVSAESKPDPSLVPHVPPIAWKELKVGELIGNGSYGDVYQGEWQKKSGTAEVVAIKLLHQKKLSPKLTTDFKQETTIMWECRSLPTIVHLHGICTESGHYAMVMEYMAQNLCDRLEEEKDLPWLQRWQIALDIAQGLAFLHSRNIVHRDLKSANILLDVHGRAKISDFGLAKIKSKVGSSSAPNPNTMGSTRWRAPETIGLNAKHTFASDVYSLGMILWELASRRLPFGEENNESVINDCIKKGELDQIPEDCPKALRAIIQACRAAPNKRPTAAEIVSRLQKAYNEALQDASKPASKDDVERIIKAITHVDGNVLGVMRQAVMGNVENLLSPAISADSKAENPPQPESYSPPARRETAGGTPLHPELPVSRNLISNVGSPHPEQTATTPHKADQKQPRSSQLLVTPVVANSPLHAGSSKQPLPTASELKLDAKEVGQFLQHIANAEYDAVEAWLAKKPEFVLCRGKVTDLSKRTFPNITPFQYALWALDWHMWTILMKYSKYLTLEEAARQWYELETKGTPHGKEASWQGLIDAYDTYAKAKSDWKNIWCKQVGGGQFLAPAHVGNEYCHPTRSMDPTPNFTTSTRGAGAKEFYVDGLGDTFAWVRGELGQGRRSTTRHPVFPGRVIKRPKDDAAVSALKATRRQQKAELVKTFSAALSAAKVSSSPQLKKT